MSRILPCLLVLVGACVWIEPLEDDYELRDPNETAGGAAGTGGAGAAAGSSPMGGHAGAGGIGGGAGGASPTILTFGERDTSNHQGVTSDTQLDFTDKDANYGAAATGWADNSSNERRVTLFRFDLSAIPTSATVTAVSLSLFTGSQTLSNSVGTVRFHELLESWNEGDQTGTTGVASWNDREVDVPWTQVGAGPGSHEQTVELGTLRGVEVDTEYTIALPVELVQRWVADGSSNHGMIALTAALDGTEMVLSEHADPTHRPELTVTVGP